MVRLDDGRIVHFGALGYEQYRDSSPLKLYSSDDHLDTKRRDNYYSRHKKDYPPFSPDYLSKKYLW